MIQNQEVLKVLVEFDVGRVFPDVSWLVCLPVCSYPPFTAVSVFVLASGFSAHSQWLDSDFLGYFQLDGLWILASCLLDLFGCFCFLHLTTACLIVSIILSVLKFENKWLCCTSLKLSSIWLQFFMFLVTLFEHLSPCICIPIPHAPIRNKLWTWFFSCQVKSGPFYLQSVQHTSPGAPCAFCHINYRFIFSVWINQVHCLFLAYFYDCWGLSVAHHCRARWKMEDFSLFPPGRKSPRDICKDTKQILRHNNWSIVDNKMKW